MTYDPYSLPYYSSPYSGQGPDQAYGSALQGGMMAGAMSGSPWAAAAGAGVSLLQGWQADRHRTTQRQRGKKTIWRDIKPTVTKWWDRAQAEAEKVPGTIEQGFSDASRQAGEAFRGAAYQASDLTRQSASQAQASLANQGLMSSSLYQNVRLGMGAQTARLFTDIMDRLTRLQTGLTTQGAMAQANAQQGLSSFYQAREVAENAPNLLLYQLRSSK